MAKVTWGWKPPQYEVLSGGVIRLFYRSEEQTRVVQRTEYRPVVKEELPTDEEVYEPSQEELDALGKEANFPTTEETEDQFVQEDEMVESSEEEVFTEDFTESEEPGESVGEESIEEPQMEAVIVEEEITEWICDVVEIKDDALLALIKSDPEGLECQKRMVEECIKAYDGSEYVNSFTFGGVQMWLDKATRVGLKLRFEAEIALGKETTTLWLNGMNFTLPLSGEQSAMNVLVALEVYASASYDVTQMHLANVAQMTTAEEVLAYDHTSGYPEKLAF